MKMYSESVIYASLNPWQMKKIMLPAAIKYINLRSIPAGRLGDAFIQADRLIMAREPFSAVPNDFPKLAACLGETIARLSKDDRKRLLFSRVAGQPALIELSPQITRISGFYPVQETREIISEINYNYFLYKISTMEYAKFREYFDSKRSEKFRRDICVHLPNIYDVSGARAMEILECINGTGSTFKILEDINAKYNKGLSLFDKPRLLFSLKYLSQALECPSPPNIAQALLSVFILGKSGLYESRHGYAYELSTFESAFGSLKIKSINLRPDSTDPNIAFCYNEQ